MKLKKILLYFLSCFLISVTNGQIKVSGIAVPSTYSLEGKNLQLNGAGVREKYFIDLYVGALFLTSKSKDEKAIVNADETMAMKIYIVSGLITKEKMEEAIRDGFKKSTGGKMDAYKSKIDAFVKAVSEDIKKGVVYDITYSPEQKKIRVYKDKVLKTEIDGLDFKRVLLSIWLGTNPVDNDLKESLLGID
jgi:hypothetical protein